MTNPEDDAGRIESSDSTAGGSEPPASGDDASSGEETRTWPTQQGAGSYPPAYGPPAYGPPPSGYVPPTYPPPPGYPPQGYGRPGYPPPYPDPTPYQGYGQPGYPPPIYGAGGFPSADLGYGAPPPAGNNSLAVGSLVVSIVSLPLFFICGVGLVGSIVGIVLGVVALNQIKQSGQSGHGLAVAGIAIGAVVMLLSLAFFAIAVALD